MATYNFKDFVSEIRSKLSLVHKVSEQEIGKNKIYFYLDGALVTVRKNKDSETKTRKTIISCSEMFPCVIKNKYEGSILFTDVDVVRTVNSLDSYLLEELGYDPLKAAICSRYYNLKYILLPLLLNERNTDGISQTWKDILDYLGYSFTNPDSNTNRCLQCKGTLIPFFCKNIKEKEDEVLIILADGLQSQFFTMSCKDNKITGYNNPKFIGVIEYGKYSDTKLISAVKSIIKDLYDFKLCDLKFDENDIIVFEEKKDENE